MILDERPVCYEEASLNTVLETTLPSVFTDYLDLLLEKGAELHPDEPAPVESVSPESLPRLNALSPERSRVQYINQGLSQFECVYCRIGSHNLLIPLDRIQRIEKLDAHHKRDRLDIPECSGESYFVLQMMRNQGNIYVHSVSKILWVQSEDILWRTGQPRAPWFVGTHKSLLCRLFDPNFLVVDSSEKVSFSDQLVKR